MKKLAFILSLLMIYPVINQAQDTTSVAQSRKDNLIELLNYRYKGGFYSFEKEFNNKVTYPVMAGSNCIMGIVLVSLVVDCNGTISDVRLKNPLGYGIDEMVSSFFAGTENQWNRCSDDKYTKMEIPIQFRTKGTKTDEESALLVCIGENPGFLCNDDEYYLKRAEKYLKKGNGKRAMEALDILIKRNPYNNVYYEMKKKAIEM
ncbi:MAG: hypothetical protein WC341_10635 [Bacteroidales bacterium]|jgi:hypothetical protein